jgi:hypothetical protein
LAYVDVYSTKVQGLDASFGGWAKNFLFRYGWLSK